MESLQTVPEVKKFLGRVHTKYGSFIIAIVGMITGAIGLLMIIIFGLMEDGITGFFVQDPDSDKSVKKAFLMILGMTCLFLFCGCFTMLVGLLFKSNWSVLLGCWVILFMLVGLLIAFIALPTACLFLPDSCVVKQATTSLFVFSYLVLTCFLWAWFYFVVVVFNYLNSVKL